MQRTMQSRFILIAGTPIKKWNLKFDIQSKKFEIDVHLSCHCQAHYNCTVRCLMAKRSVSYFHLCWEFRFRSNHLTFSNICLQRQAAEAIWRHQRMNCELFIFLIKQFPVWNVKKKYISQSRSYLWVKSNSAVVKFIARQRNVSQINIIFPKCSSCMKQLRQYNSHMAYKCTCCCCV